MTTQEIIGKVLESGIFLYVQGDQLKYRAPVGALSAELGMQLKLHRAAIIDHLNRMQAAASASDPVGPAVMPTRPDRGGRVPLSYAQRRLWFIDRLGHGSAQYHIQSTHRLTGVLNVSALRRALTTLVGRHESLRTLVVEEDGVPYQTLLPQVELDLRETDLSGFRADEQESEVRRLIAADAAVPFDLSCDLPIRTRLFVLGPSSFIVSLELHHIACDAWSLGILQKELVTLYSAYCDGLPDPLVPLTRQYMDYSVWQQDWLTGDVLARQLEFWKTALKGIPQVHDLPLDYPRPAMPAHVGAAEACLIDGETLTRIRALCKRYDVSLSMFLHAALSILIARYSGETDVVMGMPVAGRVHPDLEGIVGLFVNTLVLRVRLDGNPRFEDVLAREKQHMLGAIAHQHVPFEMLVEELKPGRSARFNPVFQILFNVSPPAPGRVTLPELTLETVRGTSMLSKFDLVLSITEYPEELSIYFSYSTEIFAAPTIARMIAGFRALLASILAAPTQRVLDLAFITSADQDRLLTVLNHGRDVPIYILDAEGRLVPEGARGEVCVPALPDDAVASNEGAVGGEVQLVPTSPNEGATTAIRLRRTGDLARWSPAGTLELLGRVSDRMTTGSIRTDVSRFRAALTEASFIRRFAVLVRADSAGRDVLVAYVVLDEVSPESRATLLDGLQRSLAAAAHEQAVTFALVPVDRIPILPNGDVQVESLPEPDAFIHREAPQRPMTETERRMEAVWRTVLNHDVGMTENFFEAGGHSLSMIVLIKRIEKEFDVDIPLATFIESPTIRATAALVAGAMPAQTLLHPIVPVSDAERARPLPLSFPQTRMWCVTRLPEARPSYNIPGAVRITGPLCLESLRRAFETIVTRHSILRTIYREEGGQPVQVILAPDVFTLPLLDLSALPDDEQAERVRTHSRAEALRPFDLAREPGLRVLVLKLAADRHVLLLNAALIAADGYSFGILVKEMNALYGAYRQGTVPALPDLSIQYGDYAVWQRQALASERFTEGLRFWKERLRGIPKLHRLPLDHPRPSYPSYRGASYSTAVPRDIVSGLEKLSRSHNGTLFTSLEAAFAVLLHRNSAERDIVIGTTFANRAQPEVAPLIGHFVNLLVLRSDVSGHDRFSDFLAANNRGILQAFAHQSTPFELLVQELNPPRDLSHAPLFQVLFNFQNDQREPIGLSDLTFAPGENEYLVCKFDLALAARETARGLSLTWKYATDIFARSTIERLASSFAALLESIVCTPGARIDELSLGADSEQPRRRRTPDGPTVPHSLIAESNVAAGGGSTPTTATERRILEIWQDVLQTERIGVDDNFFALGGHSMLACRFISETRDTLGVDVPMRTVFERQTIRGCAAWVDEHLTGSPDAMTPAGDDGLVHLRSGTR